MESVEAKMDEAQVRNLSTVQLVKHALTEAKLLARAEVLHAKHELKEELVAARTAGILLGACLALALSGLAVLFVAVALVLPVAAPIAVLLVGAGLLVVAGVLGMTGFKRLPKKPLARTQERLKRDFRLTREGLQ